MTEIAELRAAQARIAERSRERAKLITKTTDAARGLELEAEHDADMAEYDRLQDQIDVELRDRRRPNPDEGHVQQGPAYFLRARQTFVDYVIRGGSETIDGLTEGAYLRSMVLGAKTEAEKRALAEGSDSTGGYTVPDVLSARLIDRMRAKAVVFKAGAVTVPLTSDRNVIARVASDPAPAWRLENAAIAESEPTFDAAQLVPRSLAVMVKISRELLEDSLNLETALPNIMAEAMAVELDRVALLGTGVAPQPLGIANFTGLTASGFAGGALSYGALLKARTALRSANTDMAAVVMHPRDEGALSELVDTTGQPLNIPPGLANVQWHATTAMPINGGAGTNEGTVIAGDFSKLMIGIRSSLRIEVSRELFAANHQLAFVAHLRADVAAERNAHFTKLTGVVA